MSAGDHSERREAPDPPLPQPRGAISAAVIEMLRGPAPDASRRAAELPISAGGEEPMLDDDDAQLALYVLYELHYRGFAGVDWAWEWHPAALACRAALEAAFAQEMRSLAGSGPVARPGAVDRQLREILEGDDGPSLSRFIESRANAQQVCEFVVHRSAYQLKEADPHSWAIPRLSGPPKAALLEIQFDEYGEGQADRMHAALFAQTMRELDLDAGYGAYLDRLPAATLATVNLMSLFGLHRRWRGAVVGHLAAFEMSSSLPNRRYSNGLLRLGYSQAARAFYDVHVLADAVHENVAAVDLAGGLARQCPSLAGDILLGARALTALERRFAEHLLACWERGESSLREGVQATV